MQLPQTTLLFNYAYPRNDPALEYYAGLRGFESAIAVVGRKTDVYVAGFEVARANQEKKRGVRVHAFPEKKILETVLKEFKGRRVGVNARFATGYTMTRLRTLGVKPVDVSTRIRDERAVKTKHEIELLRKAVRLSKQMIRAVDTSKSEREIAAEFYRLLAEKGAENSYAPIVAFDANAALPHAIPSAAHGKKVLMIDAGARLQGYGADITRTFLLNSTKEIRNTYTAVEQAQRAGIDAVAPGVACSTVAQIVEDRLKKDGYNLVHAAGHGIGLEVHEAPTVSLRSKEILKEGMVITVEPGVYVPGKFGIRIEDNVVVTRTGRKVL